MNKRIVFYLALALLMTFPEPFLLAGSIASGLRRPGEVERVRSRWAGFLSPAAPSNLRATAVGSSIISLSWNDNSNNETGFKIYRSTEAILGFEQIATTSANTTISMNTGLNSDTKYYYRVKAYNSAGNSNYSNTANATTLAVLPAAPSHLTATAASTTQINLAWRDNSNNETGFKIERSTSAGSGFAPIATTAADATSYSSTGLAADTTYYYRVRATNSAGNSTYSYVADATTLDEPDLAEGPKILRIVNDFNEVTPADWGSTKNEIVSVRIADTREGLDDPENEVLETRDRICGGDEYNRIEPRPELRDDTIEQLAAMEWPEDRADKWNLGYWDFEVELEEYWVQFSVGDWYEEDPLDREPGCVPQRDRSIAWNINEIGMVNERGERVPINYEGMFLIKVCDLLRPVFTSDQYGALCE